MIYVCMAGWLISLSSNALQVHPCLAYIRISFLSKLSDTPFYVYTVSVCSCFLVLGAMDIGSSRSAFSF